MSISPELAYIAAVASTEAPVEPTNGHVAELATLPIPVAPAPQPEVKAKRGRPSWLASASVGVVALFATGTLGYTSYTTSQQRDGTHRQLAATQVTLTAAEADAAKRKLTADYVTLYTADSGKVQLDTRNSSPATTLDRAGPHPRTCSTTCRHSSRTARLRRSRPTWQASTRISAMRSALPSRRRNRSSRPWTPTTSTSSKTGNGRSTRPC